ncbi:MAG: PIN domain-containing protein [Promicromonosporaceae bacterium]|nr:PIN domain-containing protein [Promicromonosporaceae bacterium]
MLNDVPRITERAAEILTEAPRCVVPDAALIEVVYVLEGVMGAPRSSIVTAIEVLLAEADFDAERSTWTVALAEYQAHPKLSIVDTFLAAQAVHSGRGSLYTFDAKLAEQIEVARLP